MRKAAAEEKQRLLAKRSSSTDAGDLLDFIPRVSPRLQAPLHLMPAVERMRSFKENPFEFVFSVPPRHGKTELVLHFIIWALKRDPSLNVAYLTYSADQAESKARRALTIAQAAGLELVKTAAGEWATPKNEYVLWTGINGAVTGKGFHLIIIDDPVKSRAEAESVTYRQKHWDTMQSDLMTRLEPGGSIAVVQTRWHEDDLAGRLVRGDRDEDVEPWDFVNMPAITNEGSADEKALWPERWNLERLHRRRRKVGPYAWTSLFQGQPRPRGTSVFGDPNFFEHEPRLFRAAMGVDLAYSAKTSSDYSVCVSMVRDLSSPKEAPHFYVTRVRRKQVRAPDFKTEIRQALGEYPRAPIRAYATGTEEGTFDFIRKPPNPIPVRVMPPVGDKFTRAIPLAAAWNDGRVFVPSPELATANPGKYGWVNDFLDEMKAFTGVKDAHDDQVDAAAPAYDELSGERARYPTNEEDKFSPPPRRM